MINQEDVLSGLNKGQTEAVTCKNGPLLIIAGAGTGKTTVLTRRIAWLIDKKLAKPHEILALTFTDKAANEMELRVDLMVPYGYIDVNISTFHAFGDKILRDHALDLGLRPDYKVMTLPEQLIFFRENIFDFPLKHYKSLGDPTKHVEALIDAISRAKDEDISPEEYLRWARKKAKAKDKEREAKDEREMIEKQVEIAKVYKKYQELKLAKGLVDFGDQVSLVLKLFRQSPSVLKKCQKQYKYILVDEFQDTNYAQFELLKMLAGQTGNITVVGDDDQSIYKFRGAAVSNIMNFNQTYKKSKKVLLTENYRSTQNILDAARKLIRHNDPERLEVKAKVDKKLVAVSNKGTKIVEQKRFDTVAAEADWVAQTIKEKYDSDRYKLKDFAILVRSNAEAEPFRKSLNMLGLSYQFSGGGGLYVVPEVRLLVSFLRVIGDLADSVALYQLAVSDLYNFNPLDLQKISTFAGRRNQTLHYVFTHLGESRSPESEFGVLSDVSKASLKTAGKIMTEIGYYLDYAKNRSTGEVLYEFLKRSGYLSALSKQPTPANEDKIKNIAQFFNKVREFKEITEHDRVSEFVKYLNILKGSGDNPESAQPDLDADAINILTVHKAKGLEFPVVFLVALVADKFPVRGRKQPLEIPAELVKEKVPAEEDNLSEERRLFYVGMTRAKDELYLTSAVDYGGKRDRKISPFILEALDQPKADLTVLKQSPLVQIGLFAPEEPLIPQARKRGKDEIIQLSFYQIDDYITCPLKYKYVHILKVPLLPNHRINYGSALHKTVQAYYLAVKGGKRLSRPQLVDIFKDNWSSEGYISRQHEEQRQAAGIEAVKRFYDRAKKEKKTPQYVEESFTIVEGKVQVKGRWDLVVEEKGKTSIIDFKSSEVESQEKADKKAKESLQLSIYALGWQGKTGRLPDSLALYFLETGLIGTTRKEEKELAKALAIVNKVANGIREANYQPTPNSYACGSCPYREVCPTAR